MSSIVFFFFIIGGYVFGAPISPDSLQFRIVDCIPGENEILSQHVLEITDFNETCVRVNKLSPTGNQISLHILPETESGARLYFTTQNCSTPLPELHLSLCDDGADENSTQAMVTFGFNPIHENDIVDEDNNNNTNFTSTVDTFLYTGPTVAETMHHLNEDLEEEENTTTNESSTDTTTDETSTTNSQSDSSSEDKID